MLVCNTVITGLSAMAYTLFNAHTAFWLMALVLLIGGFFRSLQFTAMAGQRIWPSPRSTTVR